MDKRIYLVGGSKGGVGKSLVSMAIVDYLQQTGEDELLVDSDTSNPDVWKAYQEHVKAHLVDLENRRTLVASPAAPPRMGILVGAGYHENPSF